MVNNHRNNLYVRLIYEGLCFIVSVIDLLDYTYMIEWRNDMMSWKMEMEKRYDWVGKNQRNIKYCNCENKEIDAGEKKK